MVSKAAPLERLRQALGLKREVEAILERMSGNTAKPLREPLRVIFEQPVTGFQVASVHSIRVVVDITSPVRTK
jgi:hypothetical protein